MTRENLSLDTSFDALIYSENAIFSSLVTVLTLKWHGETEEQYNFSLLNQVSTVVFTFTRVFAPEYCAILGSSLRE